MRLTSIYRSASFYISAAFALGLFASACAAQTTSPAVQPDLTPAVISQPQRDTHEDQATTRSVSQIRIVRLSQVRGDVQYDRGTGQKFELAFANLPITVGEKLRTREGVAEVEFEDNSSIRIITDSEVEFPQLGRNDSGATTTAVHLVRGSMYVSLASSKTPSDFTIHVGAQTLTLAPASHFRVDLAATTAKLTVFQGAVTAVSDSGSLVVGKHKAATFDLTAAATPTFAHMDEPSPFDAWDKNAVDYHKTLAVAATYANSPYSYGVNDLAYYGSFSNVGGCGMMWRPYLANASFDPYASGVWSYYPSSGYSWVSLYPWGWTPFHSGSWNYCASGGGWGWQPQGGWSGLQNQPATYNTIKAPGAMRPRPPARPIGVQPTNIGVNLKALQASRPGNGDSFVFQGGSAGLGVPRGVFNNLGKISQHAIEHGVATRSISETQGARALMPTSTAVMNAQRNSQINGQINGPMNSSAAFARPQGSIGGAAPRSNSIGASMNQSRSSSMNNSMSNSSAGSRSFSPSAPSSAAAPAGGGAHPH